MLGPQNSLCNRATEGRCYRHFFDLEFFESSMNSMETQRKGFRSSEPNTPMAAMETLGANAGALYAAYPANACKCDTFVDSMESLENGAGGCLPLCSFH